METTEVLNKLGKNHAIPVAWSVAGKCTLSMWPRSNAILIEQMGFDEPSVIDILTVTIASVFCDLEPAVNLSRLDSVLNFNTCGEADRALKLKDQSVVKKIVIRGEKYSPSSFEHAFVQFDRQTSEIIAKSYKMVLDSPLSSAIVNNYETPVLQETLSVLRDRFILNMLFRTDEQTIKIVVDHVVEDIDINSEPTSQQDNSWFDTISATNGTPCAVSISHDCVNKLMEHHELRRVNSVLAYRFTLDFLSELYIECRMQKERVMNYSCKNANRMDPEVDLLEAIKNAYIEAVNKYSDELSEMMLLLIRGDRNNPLAKLIPTQISE
ncbi:hypothetical protein AB4167_06655 [Vibrio sp. 10N.286.49.E11]|uniref:hypothetical protein n=1 Tax=Vibrio sp. 10N.286.49.E11 TaxID=3229703 RepID=UPI003552A2F8